MIQEKNETLVVTQTMSVRPSIGSYSETILLLKKVITASIENTGSLRGKLRSDCEHYAEKESAILFELQAGAMGDLRKLLSSQYEIMGEIQKIRSLVETQDRAERTFFITKVEKIRVDLTRWSHVAPVNDPPLHQCTELLDILDTVLRSRAHFFETTKQLESFTKLVSISDTLQGTSMAQTNDLICDMVKATESTDAYWETNLSFEEHIAKMMHERAHFLSEFRSKCDTYLAKEKAITEELNTGVTEPLQWPLKTQQATLNDIEKIRNIVEQYNREEVVSFTNLIADAKQTIVWGPAKDPSLKKFNHLSSKITALLVSHKRFAETAVKLENLEELSRSLDVFILESRPHVPESKY